MIRRPPRSTLFPYTTLSDLFTILVRDTTPPTIAAHANLTSEATGPTGPSANHTTPLAAPAHVASHTLIYQPTSGAHFRLGTTTVTYTRHDDAGTTASSTFTL